MVRHGICGLSRIISPISRFVLIGCTQAGNGLGASPMSTSKPKCVCCKFDNCRKEFEKHQSHTTFYNMERQIEVIADMLNKEGEGYQDKICDQHKKNIPEFIESAYEVYQSMRSGVRLPIIRSRG